MSKAFRAYQPEQRLLMPLSLEQWLPEGHLARFLSDVIDELDLREMYASYEEDGRGMAAYHPLMMTKLLFYGYCVGKASSRKLEQATYEDVAVRYLAANQRSEERRVGKECRSGWWRESAKKKERRGNRADSD